MSKHVTRFPPGFDYNFRPVSYFHNLDPGALIVGSILGEERRNDVEQRLATGDFDPAVWGEWLTESKLDDSTRKLIGSVHPAFMGGEYLPSLAQNEIEIVRIVLASVTQDIMSIRARRLGKRIGYRVVDENEMEFTLPHQSSSKPLSLRHVIRFIDRTNWEGEADVNGLVFSTLDANLDACGDPESLRNFVKVKSSFYPDLQNYYAAATDRYLDQFLMEDEVEDDVA